MNKHLLCFILMLTAFSALGQKKSIVNLINSQSSTGYKLNGKDIVKVYQGTFRQDFSTLSSDSAYFYPEDNAFDAFGHVVINQGDTLHIYSDKLNYNGNTKIAILTDNVRMVDKDAVLTTNHLTYNTATRIGTYTEGGKLFNKDNTLVSKNGYYFAYSRDSYFRYDVSLTTPDALVLTDTMRYNTGTRISYFYGPTNIYGTKGEKDRDTLYTENGDYNTVIEQAAFGKNNLYKSGTKSLKGDSLFYDKLKGYGRAVKHVTFDDKEQKVTIKGDLGTYFKAEEQTIVTEDPYIIMVTEENDTTRKDSAARADSIAKRQPVANKNTMTMGNVIKNSIPVNINSHAVGKITQQVKIDSLIKKKPLTPVLAKGMVPVNIDSSGAGKKDSVAKTLAKIVTTKKPAKGPKNKAGKKAEEKNPEKIAAVKDTSKVKTDSIYMSADTIETRILTYKDLKVYLEKQRLAHLIDTGAAALKKAKKRAEKESKFLAVIRADVTIDDTGMYHRNFFGKPKPVKKKPAKPLSKKQLALDSIAKKQVADSILMAKLAEPKDTARIRIIIAHHHAKLFKSDLQGKADSMYYSNSDSTLRCYVNPILWAEGSQLTGDTLYLQMKHKQLDNMVMFPNAFMVNIEKNDSVHFNQVSGKRMRGFFKDDKLHKMLVEGNAESIYFNRDSGKTTVSGMQRSLSSRIRVYFKNNQATELSFLTKPENKYGPMAKVKEDDKILKGFIWKPKERPVSKESVIPSYGKSVIPSDNKKTLLAVKGPPKQDKTGKPQLKGGTTDATRAIAKDTTQKADTAKTTPVNQVKITFKTVTVY